VTRCRPNRRRFTACEAGLVASAAWPKPHASEGLTPTRQTGSPWAGKDHQARETNQAARTTRFRSRHDGPSAPTGCHPPGFAPPTTIRALALAHSTGAARVIGRTCRVRARCRDARDRERAFRLSMSPAVSALPSGTRVTRSSPTRKEVRLRASVEGATGSCHVEQDELRPLGARGCNGRPDRRNDRIAVAAGVVTGEGQGAASRLRQPSQATAGTIILSRLACWP
jgi:hypothetical protein